MLEPSIALALSMFENKGVYALLLGSGLSRAAHIPTGWEVTLDLARRLATLSESTPPTDIEAWYRTAFGRPLSYSHLLDSMAPSPDERRSILHRFIEPSEAELREGRKVPTKAHKAIAWLVREGFIRVIITTNFDRLLENALQQAGIEPTVIMTEDSIAGAVPLVHSRCLLIKLHGDYLDNRIRNTEEELRVYPAALNGLLDRILDEHGLVVCGWSGDWDLALRDAILRTPNRRYPTYWASRNPLSAYANDILQARRGQLVTIQDADVFFDQLRGRVETQIRITQPDPRSTELIVASGKQYVSKPEHRIQLHDLVAKELRLLQEALSDPAFSVHEGVSRDLIRERTSRYEAQSNALSRLLAVMGRWGTGDELDLAKGMIGELASQDSVGGTAVWIALRYYPAVLVHYAYGLGLLRAGRIPELLKWYTLPVRIDGRDPQPLATRLYLGTWSELSNEFWQQLEGVQNHKTALSEHLHSVIRGFSSDFVLAGSEFTVCFERFELLASIAYLTSTTSRERLSSSLDNGQGRDFTPVPMGRVAFGGSRRNALVEELNNSEFRGSVLSAGFAGGDGTWLAIMLENLRRVWSRMEW